MRRLFVTSDPHFGHKNIVKFTKKDGSKIRPWDTLEEMHEAMIDLWNQTVKPEDTVYVLGDFALGGKQSVAIAGKLNGDKVLIKGNHDIYPLDAYTPYFRDIRGCHVLSAQRVVLTHIPVHERQFDRWRLNIHGHLHSDVVLIGGHDTDADEPDKRYKCVSVEHTGFKPVLLEEALA